MLSYRHSYHAGNHADVLKHIVLVQLLTYLARKDKPFWYIDTHAGAGRYRLDKDATTNRAEFHDGIERLWHAPNVPDEIGRYVEIVRSLNHSESLQLYPGSPQFANELMRAGDRLWLFELHPADYETLRAGYSDSKAVRVAKQDGFTSLKSLLPPEPRRALIMIDPSYEMQDDYTRVVTTLADARERFATGVYAIWYPLLKRTEAAALPEKLLGVAGDRWLDVRMTVRAGRDQHAGLYGSGMFVANPPHTLPTVMNAIMPSLTGLLAQDSTATYEVNFNIP